MNLADLAAMTTKLFSFFFRLAAPDCPAGFTVSKREALPAGNFAITEYYWFVDADEFTADERQAAYDARPLAEISDA